MLPLYRAARRQHAGPGVLWASLYPYNPPTYTHMHALTYTAVLHSTHLVTVGKAQV